MPKTNQYIARVQSPCCGFEKEIWTVRGTTAANARQRLQSAVGSGVAVFELRRVTNTSQRHFKSK